RRPVLLGVVAKIISVVPHVRRDFAIDLTRSFVPQLARIPVRADRTVDSLPRVALIAASAFTSEHGFKLTYLSDGEVNLPVHTSTHRSLGGHPRATRSCERVFVLINIHELIAAEIDWVRIEYPSAAKEVWIL